MSDVLTHQVSPTKVLFSQAISRSLTRVQLIEKTDTCMYVVVEQTPFHPVSHIWPDHPADKGYFSYADETYNVLDCMTGAFDVENNKLFVGTDIPVKRGEKDWHFVVVHQVELNVPVAINDVVELVVDVQYQTALSRGTVLVTSLLMH